MEGKYTYEQFSKDLDDGYKILFNYVRNRYVVYKVRENCYMQELIEQMSRNPVPEKAMITTKAVKEMFPFMEDIEYKIGTPEGQIVENLIRGLKNEVQVNSTLFLCTLIEAYIPKRDSIDNQIYN